MIPFNRNLKNQTKGLLLLPGQVSTFFVLLPAATLFAGCGADKPRPIGDAAASGGMISQSGGVGGSESGGSFASGSSGSQALNGGIGGIIFDGAVVRDGATGDGSIPEITGGNTATSGTGGTDTTAGSGATSGSAGSPPTGSCAMSADRMRITEVDVGSTVLSGENEYNMNMLAISPIPAGGSRLAWLSIDGMVHIVQLDVNDQITGSPVTLPAHDFSDMYADDNGAVVLLTRDAESNDNHNCGNINNLCGNAATYPTDYACYNMYLVRFDGNAETWAAKLTDASASHPPYGTSPNETNRTTFIWEWYGHHGRIAFDGSRWAAYFGMSLSASSQVLTFTGCAQADSTLSVGVDIHQGDRMRIVDANGTVGPDGFKEGCSHSYYERLVWDPAASRFIPVCETDRDNTLSFAPLGPSIFAIDMQRVMPENYSNLSSIVLGSNGGYWVTISKSRAAAAGMADVHLLHFTSGNPDKDIIISNDSTLNCRAAHLGKYGNARLIAAWETSASPNDYTAWTTDRKFYLQTHSASTGEAEGGPLQVDIKGNKYYAFRDFPDGSVAYPTAGSSATKIKILRILPCN